MKSPEKTTSRRLPLPTYTPALLTPTSWCRMKKSTSLKKRNPLIKMRFLLDECVLGKTVKLLRDSNFTVTTIQELGKVSATNGTVIKTAVQEKAVIITTDLDFGNLILYPLGSHPCIIVLRPRLDTSEAIEDIHKILLCLLDKLKLSEIKESLIIVDRNKYRLKR